VTGLVGVLLGLMFVGWCSSLFNNPSAPQPAAAAAARPTAPKGPDKTAAWVMAQKFVKDGLKAPATADFGSVFGDYQNSNDIVTDLGRGKFRVVAWVDAQNSFGAKIRNHFVCELENVAGNTWRLTSLKFAEQ
jgi:hypothetical protein